MPDRHPYDRMVRAWLPDFAAWLPSLDPERHCRPAQFGQFSVL